MVCWQARTTRYLKLTSFDALSFVSETDVRAWIHHRRNRRGVRRLYYIRTASGGSRLKVRYRTLETAKYLREIAQTCTRLAHALIWLEENAVELMFKAKELEHLHSE